MIRSSPEDGAVHIEKCRRDLVTNMYTETYEGWNFNSGNYLFTTDTK